VTPRATNTDAGGFAYITGGSSSGGSVNFDFTTGALPAAITFTRPSIGTYFNNAGLLITAGNDAARFNYVGGVACLLIEPAATNILLQSNSFTNAAWHAVNSSVITAGAFVSPDGANDGTTVTSGSGFGGVAQSGVAFSNIPYTVSCWVKRVVGAAPVSMKLNDVQTGDFATTTTLTRYAGALTPSAGTNTAYIFTDTASGATNGIFGAQVETGPVATSYIPTTTAAVTRAADSAVFAIPAGIGHLTYTFDDNSTQLAAVSPGSYTAPTNLNRPNIKSIVGSA